MPKIVDTWVDGESCRINLSDIGGEIRVDIEDNIFDCSPTDAREIGERLIEMADELEAKR